MVRIDAEATTGQDRPRLLGHGEDVEGRLVSEVVGDREDLERPAEVQHFYVLEDQDGEVAGGWHGSEIRHGDEGFSSLHDDRLGKVHPAAFTRSGGRQQAQPLAGAGSILNTEM